MVEFENAYFIKLGRRGGWEKSCIEDGLIRLGFVDPFHKLLGAELMGSDVPKPTKPRRSMRERMAATQRRGR